jgi:hypothetical protein
MMNANLGLVLFLLYLAISSSKGSFSRLSRQRIISEWKEINADGLSLNNPFTNYSSEVSQKISLPTFICDRYLLQLMISVGFDYLLCVATCLNGILASEEWKAALLKLEYIMDEYVCIQNILKKLQQFLF